MADEREIMSEARGWIADCGGNPVGMTDGEVRSLINAHYVGRWEQFIIDANGGVAA